MDVEKMVDLWVPVIKALCMAHSKEEIDRAEFAMEDLLNPLLTAPVRDLRKFYTKLVQCLKADTTIPFFVWAAFDAWEEVVVKPAPDADIKMLKNELAKEIADMVEEQVRPDIGKAIAGALRWRDPETLEKMRASLKEGKPAKVRGRESCLFLEVEDHCVML